jgi:hypothetical protein
MRWSCEQNAGTGCRVAGEGASIFVESLDEGCQIFTYSEPGCVRILAFDYSAFATSYTYGNHNRTMMTTRDLSLVL